METIAGGFRFGPELERDVGPASVEIGQNNEIGAVVGIAGDVAQSGAPESLGALQVGDVDDNGADVEGQEAQFGGFGRAIAREGRS